MSPERECAMEELVKLLIRKWGFCTGPVGSDHNWLVVHWYYSFEPHGAASEDWEEVWQICLPGIRTHWHHLRDGWIPCKSDKAAHFEAPKLTKAIARTKTFLEQANPDASQAKLWVA